MSDSPESPQTIADAAEHEPRGRAAVLLNRARGLIAPGLIAFAAGSVCGQFLVEDRASERLPRDVFVLGKDVSGWDFASARKALHGIADAAVQRELTLQIDQKRVSVRAADLGVGIDVDETLRRAVAARRDRPILPRFVGWLASLLTTLPASEPTLVVDANRLQQRLAEVERANVDLPFAGGFRTEGGRVVAEYPRAGRKLDVVRARAEIERALRAGERAAVLTTQAVPAPTERDAIDRLVKQAETVAARDVVLDANELRRSLRISGAQLLAALRVANGDRGPALQLEPDALAASLADARKNVENDARSARFVIDAADRVSIVASEPERRLDWAEVARAALAATAASERHGALPLRETALPALSSDDAAKLSIRGLVSQFTTRHPCCERRVENIHHIADLLNGLIVKPGETVSVNAIVGPRTQKNGFVPAPTIEEGEMVETFGGGISQFATTMYNALFYGGYDIIERQPHTYWFPRYPMGHEATLSYPKPDLIFRNDTEAGMLFDMRYTGTSITVRIFGDNGGRRVEAKVSPRQNIVQMPVEILPNPEVAPDKEHVLQSGMIGWSVMVARILHFPDGTRREEKRKVTYKPKTRRVEVHPCRIPRGEEGYTGEPCPEPPPEEEDPASAAPH